MNTVESGKTTKEKAMANVTTTIGTYMLVSGKQAKDMVKENTSTGEETGTLASTRVI